MSVAHIYALYIKAADVMYTDEGIIEDDLLVSRVACCTPIPWHQTRLDANQASTKHRNQPAHLSLITHTKETERKTTAREREF